MEKVLRELDTTWTTMKFETEPHSRTKQALEDNQVIK